MGSEWNEPRYADSLERIAKSLESIDHSLRLIVTPRRLESLSAYSVLDEMVDMLEKHDSHDIAIETLQGIGEESTMYRAVCNRCGLESRWFPNAGLAKSNLNKYACETRGHCSKKAAKRELDNKECE